MSPFLHGFATALGVLGLFVIGPLAWMAARYATEALVVREPPFAWAVYFGLPLVAGALAFSAYVGLLNVFFP